MRRFNFFFKIDMTFPTFLAVMKDDLGREEDSETLPVGLCLGLDRERE